MPSLGAGMDTGRVLEWYVHPGDTVHRGDVIALVETDKAAIEVEVFEDGVVEDLVVPAGTKVDVGTVLAHLGDAGSPQAHAPPAARAAPAARPTPTAVPAPAVASASHVRASPYARRLAGERGLDLAALDASGPGGAVVARDVAPMPPGPAPPSPDSTAEPSADRATSMRQAIGRAMSESKHEIPHYYLGHHVDVEDALRWLEQRNATRPTTARVLPAALLLAATARACRDHPDMNGHWVDGTLRPADGVHLGVAISLRGGGLAAPAIHDADQRSLDDLMGALTDLVRRARAGRLRGSEVADATITVTNLGDRGVESVYGILHPPQVALVGAGRITTRPWVVDGQVVARRVVHVTLSADHRASDGHTGGLFLDALAHHLQEPETS